MSAETNPSIRVLIADDQQIIQQGLATILKYQPGISVVGTASNGQEAVERAQQLQPDVVLMDIRMPVLDGVRATTRLRQLLPAIRVLILTTFDDEEYVVEALKAGASGYLLKDIPGEELAQTVRAVHAGIYQLDPAVAAKVIAALSRPASSASPPPVRPPKIDLTERELEILRLIASGATNREIAEKLVLAEGTVKNHISNILSRLGLRDRTQAAIFARENGLL